MITLFFGVCHHLSLALLFSLSRATIRLCGSFGQIRKKCSLWGDAPWGAQGHMAFGAENRLISALIHSGSFVSLCSELCEEPQEAALIQSCQTIPRAETLTRPLNLLSLLCFVLSLFLHSKPFIYHILHCVINVVVAAGYYTDLLILDSN